VLRASPLGKDAELASAVHRLCPIGCAKLVEYVAGVLLHRVQCDDQLSGDVAVTVAGGQQP
jgi:hypothetical protein